MVTHRQLKVDSETYELINLKCREEYLRLHPELKKIKISQNKLLYEIGRYYIES